MVTCNECCQYRDKGSGIPGEFLPSPVRPAAVFRSPERNKGESRALWCISGLPPACLRTGTGRWTYGAYLKVPPPGPQHPEPAGWTKRRSLSRENGESTGFAPCSREQEAPRRSGCGLESRSFAFSGILMGYCWSPALMTCPDCAGKPMKNIPGQDFIMNCQQTRGTGSPIGGSMNRSPPTDVSMIT